MISVSHVFFLVVHHAPVAEPATTSTLFRVGARRTIEANDKTATGSDAERKLLARLHALELVDIMRRIFVGESASIWSGAS